jgi:ABC-type transport system involved in multi-copper enzyme maturation permease subunit
MRGMGAVLRRDLKEMRRLKAFLLLVIIFAVITIGAAVGASIGLNNSLLAGPEIDWGAIKPALELTIGLIVYLVTLFALMMFIWMFTGEPITKEKANGNIESLLATPLTAKTIWIGKSLAVFLPAFFVAVVSTLIILLAVNFAAIYPAAGNFVWSAPVLVSCQIIG